MSITPVDLLVVQKDNTWDVEEWIVPLSTALEGLTAEQAAWAPPGGGNTIWQTVNHINYYNGRMLSRLKGIEPGPRFETNEESSTVLEFRTKRPGKTCSLKRNEFNWNCAK